MRQQHMGCRQFGQDFLVRSGWQLRVRRGRGRGKRREIRSLGRSSAGSTNGTLTETIDWRAEVVSWDL